ncbi:MAG: LysM peptidoglycan-binding domain-containing protein, partial [Kiritimatiellaeota bacterium]|nr:LysM peptidoglycan-binding domain-containing protein [Kiritimatiellota bacterium]
MQAVEQKNQWKSRLIVSAVAGAHVLAVSTLLMLYGCTTPKSTAKIEPPASPIMPPTREPSPVVEKTVIPPPPVLDLVQPPAKEVSTAPKTYVVQPGDMISKIAHRAGVSANEIVSLNHLKNANSIRVGQKLVLPAFAKDLPAGKVKEAAVAKKSSGAKKVTSSTAAKKPAAAAPAGGYEVKSGDSLEKIAKKFGVKIADLQTANNLSGDKIRAGQKLTIPGKGGEAAPVAPAADTGTPAPAPDMGAAPVAPAAPPTLLDYTVQDGETVDSVAKT